MIMVQPMAQPMTSFRTTTPSTAKTGRATTKLVNPVHVHRETSCKTLLEHCMHVHQPTVQVCKLGESLALRSQAPTQWKDFCEQTPIDKARHSVTIFQLLSRYRTFSRGSCTNFTSSQNTSLHDMHQVPIHLETAFKEEIESLVKQGILEGVK